MTVTEGAETRLEPTSPKTVPEHVAHLLGVLCIALALLATTLFARSQSEIDELEADLASTEELYQSSFNEAERLRPELQNTQWQLEAAQRAVNRAEQDPQRVAEEALETRALELDEREAAILEREITLAAGDGATTTTMDDVVFEEVPPPLIVRAWEICVAPTGAVAISADGDPMTCATQQCDGTQFDSARWRRTVC